MYVGDYWDFTCLYTHIHPSNSVTIHVTLFAHTLPTNEMQVSFSEKRLPQLCLLLKEHTREKNSTKFSLASLSSTPVFSPTIIPFLLSSRDLCDSFNAPNGCKNNGRRRGFGGKGLAANGGKREREASTAEGQMSITSSEGFRDTHTRTMHHQYQGEKNTPADRREEQRL